MTKKEMQDIIKIAKKNFIGLAGRDGLETKRSDSEDFIEAAVWEIKDALAAAYELGKETGRRENK